jgi:hypothetical protein
MRLQSKDVESVVIIFDRWKLEDENPDIDPSGVGVELE